MDGRIAFSFRCVHFRFSAECFSEKWVYRQGPHPDQSNADIRFRLYIDAGKIRPHFLFFSDAGNLASRSPHVPLFIDAGTPHLVHPGSLLGWCKGKNIHSIRLYLAPYIVWLFICKHKNSPPRSALIYVGRHEKNVRCASKRRRSWGERFFYAKRRRSVRSHS